MEQYLISVDLGSSKVVAALGRRSVSNETIVVDIVEKPMEGYTRGEITNILQVTNAIDEAVKELAERNSVKVEKVWVSVAGKHVVCTDNSGSIYVSGAGGEVTTKDVEKLNDNMNNVQAPEGKVILDRITQRFKVDTEETLASPVGRFGHQLSTTVNFVLGGKSVLDRITNAFGRIGIENVRFISGAIASGQVVASDEEKEAGVVVIDLGAGTTDLCIIQNKIVRYVASIPIGSGIINNDIRTMGIPANSIERLKLKCGYATASAIPDDKINCSIKINTHSQHQKSKEITYRDLTTIIEARMLDIIGFVIDEIKFSGYHDKLSGGIILTGGGSQLNGIDTLFRERTGRDVRISGAEQNIAFTSTDKAYKPQFATSVGLLDVGIAQSDIEPYEEEEEIVEQTPEKVTPAETPKESTPTETPTLTEPKDVAPTEGKEDAPTEGKEDAPTEGNNPQDENPPLPGDNGKEKGKEKKGDKGNKGDKKGGFLSKVWGKVEKILIGDIVDDNI